MKGLLLLSSDDRRRYAEDIQTALALPEGGIIQFRYRMRWIEPALLDAVQHHQTEGAVAVLGFVDTDRHEPFVLPVRYATVAKAELVADLVIFRLRVRGYPNLHLYPLSFAGIVEVSSGAIGQLRRHASGKFYPATSNLPAMPDEVVDNAPSRWLATARLLALHRTFKDSYFLRVAPPETDRHKELRFDATGRIAIAGSESVRISTHVFAEQYVADAEFKLTCSTDGTNLRVASDDVYHVALRYDAVEFWLQPADLNYDTSSVVRISLASEKAGARTIAANVQLPLVVRRSRSRTLRLWPALSRSSVRRGRQ